MLDSELMKLIGAFLSKIGESYLASNTSHFLSVVPNYIPITIAFKLKEVGTIQDGHKKHNFIHCKTTKPGVSLIKRSVSYRKCTTFFSIRRVVHQRYHIKLIWYKNESLEALTARIKEEVKENEGNECIDLITI
ncbi:hypothetical protein H5410_002350 [Solanum commersonii]|uniref:Uncharacterized protein n=1 Tax=Solanum commersonii TaxID=4109 RepID=A0A9J6B1P8_SOLCO|nr:hypothetical protein H5410_002350 [Solanum commersonii]